MPSALIHPSTDGGANSAKTIVLTSKKDIFITTRVAKKQACLLRKNGLDQAFER